MFQPALIYLMHAEKEKVRGADVIALIYICDAQQIRKSRNLFIQRCISSNCAIIPVVHFTTSASRPLTSGYGGSLMRPWPTRRLIVPSSATLLAVRRRCAPRPALSATESIRRQRVGGRSGPAASCMCCRCPGNPSPGSVGHLSRTHRGCVSGS